MRSMIVLMAIAAMAVAQAPWHQPAAWNTNWAAHGAGGAPVQDTPEVAAAKAAHFAAVARAGGAPATYAPGPAPYAAAPAWNHGGLPAPVQDTPEVAAAKAAHFAALNNAASQSQQYAPAHTGSRWNGPIALPPGYDANGAPLPVQDTPEVAAERANHFALVSRSNGPAGVNTWSGHNAGAWSAPNAGAWAAPNTGAWAGHNAGAWSGHNGGLPADTPEVAAAKAAHLAAHQSASGHRWRRSVLAYTAPVATAHLAPIVAAPVVAAPVVAAPLVRSVSLHSTAIAHPTWAAHW